MESETVNCSIDDDLLEEAHDGLNILDDLNPDVSVSEPERLTKKSKTTTSHVWKYFTKIGVKDGKEKAKCNSCGNEYVIGGTKIQTSTLGRHLVKCKGKPLYKDQDVAGMIIDHAGRLRV